MLNPNRLVVSLCGVSSTRYPSQNRRVSFAALHVVGERIASLRAFYDCSDFVMLQGQNSYVWRKQNQMTANLECDERGNQPQESNPRSVCLAQLLRNLRSPPEPFKLLKLQFLLALKRLASAVQLRPWPPSFQGLSHSHPAIASPLSVRSRKTLRTPSP